MPTCGKLCAGFQRALRQGSGGTWQCVRGLAGASLDDVLCVQLDRQVGRDNCVSWSGRSLQIPAQQHRHHYVKATVWVHEYPDGRLAVFDGPRCLARYDTTGTLLDDPLSRAA